MTPERPTAGELVVCATPIGNLEDVTLRVLRELEQADVLACEDTRHTRRLLERHGIEAAELVSYHEHNERDRAAELIRRMSDGQTVALVSDAGMPLISDPGFPLLTEALRAGLEVRVLPGASAALTALVAAGLPADHFRFAGFLPRKGAELERQLIHTPETLVAFESPKRLAHTLALLSEHDPTRQVAVCRELTKLHEEVRRGEASQLAAHYREHPARGEVVLVVAAAPRRAGEMSQTLEVLAELVGAGARPRPAAKAVAKLTGLSANEIYREHMRRISAAELMDGEEAAE
jgi:16S rRNA (cytidine1402-2'-O)-methyltransferase